MDAPKCIVCGQRHWSRQDAICRFLERPLFSCAFQRYRLLQQIGKPKISPAPREFSSYRFLTHPYKKSRPPLGHAHQGVGHPSPMPPSTQVPPAGAPAITQRSAQIRAKETRKPEMTGREVPTTSERIGSSRELGHQHGHNDCAARAGVQSRFRYRVALKIVRRSADKTWPRQWRVHRTAGARDWLLGTLRKGSAGHSLVIHGKHCAPPRANRIASPKFSHLALVRRGIFLDGRIQNLKITHKNIDTDFPMCFLCISYCQK